MAKITPIVVYPSSGYDTGETAKDKLNEAMDSVEVSAKLTGDGNTGTELDIAANAITNTELAQIATAIIKGRTTAGTGNVEDLTLAQIRAMVIDGFTTTATAAGTTTLTSSSTYNQEFTGVTTQTIVMPVVSTLVLGRPFKITNNSTGLLTVNSSGSDLITTVATGLTVIITCVKITGTDETSWSIADFGGGGLSSVSTDSTLDGDGTPGDPLSVIGGGGAATQVVQGTAYTFLGELLNDSFPGTSLNATNWSGGLPTGASVNDKLIIASGSAAWDRYITLANLYVFEKLDIEIDMVAVTKNSGDAWGIFSDGNLASGYQSPRYIKFDQNTGILSSGTTTSATGESIQPIAFSAGNNLKFTFKRKPDRTVVIIENLTTGDKVFGEFSFCHWGTEGYYKLSFLGGQQEFNNATISSTCRNYGGSDGIVFIGDSIGRGSGASTIADRWINKLMYGQQHLFESLCVNSIDTTDISASILTDMVGDINAKYMVINLGFNDESRSIPTATYQTNLETLASTAQGLGYTVLMVTQFPKTYTDNSSYISAMQTAATNSGSTFINLTPYLGNTGEHDWLYDIVHPNDYGHSLIANAILELANEFFEDILTDIDNEDILFRHLGYSNEMLPLCAIDEKGRMVKTDPSKYSNKRYISLQLNSNGTLVYRKQNGHIGITGIIYNGSHYHQNPGATGQGLRIGFNNGINDTSASNINITNNGGGGSGSVQDFNSITGKKNILIDALNVKGAYDGSISGDSNIFINSPIANGAIVSGDENIFINNNNSLTTGKGNIMIGNRGAGTASYNYNIVLSTRPNYNGAVTGIGAFNGVIAIGTWKDYSGAESFMDGEVCISGYTRNKTKRYTFGPKGGLMGTASIFWRAGASAGTDINAVKLYIDGHAGTGSGNAGQVIFRTSTPGASGSTFQSYTEQLTISDGAVSVEKVLKIGQFTATEASALTPADADLIYVTSTDATFTSIGVWAYENGSWIKL